MFARPSAVADVAGVLYPANAEYLRHSASACPSRHLQPTPTPTFLQDGLDAYAVAGIPPLGEPFRSNPSIGFGELLLGFVALLPELLYAAILQLFAFTEHKVRAVAANLGVHSRDGKVQARACAGEDMV